MRFACWIIVFLVVLPSTAQHTVRGKVIESTTERPLPYATVVLKGTTRGTITNEDGRFQLILPGEDDSLLVRHVGHHPAMIAVASGDAELLIRMTPAQQHLREVIITPDPPQYGRVVNTALRLRKIPAVETKLFFGMRTTTGDSLVEVVQAYHNATYRAARLDDFVLKQGRIGLTPVNDRFYINYNTSKAFALMDIIHQDKHYPLSPLSIFSAGRLKKAFVAELVSRGSGINGIDHIRVTPRQQAKAFTLDLWLDSGSDQVHALELSCRGCGRHPFVSMFPHGQIDSLHMRYRQTWSTEPPILPEVMELEYDVAYTGPMGTQQFSTQAIMHAFDHGKPFIPPLFHYAKELPDYRKLAWLPVDSVFWKQVSPPIPSERQNSEQTFLELNDIRSGPWFKQLENEHNFFGAHYAIWSRDIRYSVKKIFEDLQVPGLDASTPSSNIEVQLYLDMDTTGGTFHYTSATVLDAMLSYHQDIHTPWTNSYINILFDLGEMERQRMVARLAEPRMTADRAREIHQEHSRRLRSLTRNYLAETDHGRLCEPLFKWNNEVVQGLGIDNIKLLGL